MLFNFGLSFRQNIRFFRNLANAKERYDMSNVIKVSENAVNEAVKKLREGEIIALPTDTVYGLAVDPQNPEALAQLYNLKGRNFCKPIAICVGRVDDIKNWGRVETLPPKLLQELLPGPVTILLKRTNLLSLKLNPGVDKVGIRIPDSKFICDIASNFGSAIALTSANTSNEPSTLSPKEFSHLWPKLGAVFDGGILSCSEAARAGSTIVNLTEPGKFSIVRKGSAEENTLDILLRCGLMRQS